MFAYKLSETNIYKKYAYVHNIGVNAIFIEI